MATIEEVPLSAFRAVARCGECNTGQMVAKGSQDAAGLYWHVCDNCGAVETLDKAYPQTMARETPPA